MGHRSLIGKTSENGKIEVYYAHWGALNAYDSGNENIKVPEESNEKGFILKDKFEFGEKVDYLHHEAIWLDSVCYKPIWVFPAKTTKIEEWKTEGKGILIKCKTGISFNRYNYFEDAKDLIDELTDLNVEDKIKLFVNFVVGVTCDGDIPDFSPYGYDWKYRNTKEFYDDLKKNSTEKLEV